jgi:hypothetical protein
VRFVFAVLLILFAARVNASELRITVEGIRSPDGTILIGLYDSLESFTRAIELSDKDGFLNDPNRFAAVALRAKRRRRVQWFSPTSILASTLLSCFMTRMETASLIRTLWVYPVNPMGSVIMCGGFSAPQPSKTQSCRSMATKLFALCWSTMT